MDNFIEYVDDYDISDEIETQRYDKGYCEDFSIVESVNDFQHWYNYLKSISRILEGEFSLPYVNGTYDFGCVADLKNIC